MNTEIKATMFHDAGAFARCQKCGRYTLDCRALGPAHKQPRCDCGEQHFWTGSFVPPGPDARWFRDRREP